MVLFMMPMAVELLQCIGVRGCGCPITLSVSLKIVACLQLRKSALSLASAAEVTTKRNIARKVKNAPFTVMGLVGSRRQPMKKIPQAWLWAFASVRYDAPEWMLSIMTKA